MDNLIHADCLDAMAAMAADSIDAIVTDPPYGIRFMGKAWDGADIDALIADRQAAWEKRQAEGRGHPDTTIGSPAAAAGTYDQSLRGNRAFQEWCEAWAREAFRVAKPGAHLLAFGGTRTVHRLAAAIEDAGWEIRDMLVWGYASGFPKSLDVSKAITATQTLGSSSRTANRRAMTGDDSPSESFGSAGSERSMLTARSTPPPVANLTPDAEKWNGWGTALKPAWEPIVMARKPLRGTVAANVLRHGTGALNIDGTRIGTEGGTARATNPTHMGRSDMADFTRGNFGIDDIGKGRWPANVILTDPIFDGGIDGVVGGGEQSGGGNPPHRAATAANLVYGKDLRNDGRPTGLLPVDTSGTYSRFFLIPKSARAEREPVLGGLPVQRRATRDGGEFARQDARAGTDRNGAMRQNVHPTVKPLDLMRHLVRLVTPPGGLVLDPFLGSGTTALAAEMEGFAWIGIEKEAEYIAITEARLNGTQRGLGLGA